MKKICMVYCYFGKWPAYMGLFVESCKYNPSIDFLIFSDSGEISGCPGNVKVIPFDRDKFNALASSKLGFEIRIDDPYKLCDFKPCYGFIFGDYIKEYDHWGYGDIDVIFGNIRKFITDELLDSYDIITSGKEFLYGHFTMMKNSDGLRRLFMRSADYKAALQSGEYCSFDECVSWKTEAGMNTIIALQKGKNIQDCDMVMETMTHVVKKLQDNGELSVYFRNLFKDGSDVRVDHHIYLFQYKWEKGKLWDVEDGEEFMYVHLFGLKHNQAFLRWQEWKEIPDSLLIAKDILSAHHDFAETEKKEIIDHYCLRYFPRTTTLLSVLTPDYKQAFYRWQLTKPYQELFDDFFRSEWSKFLPPARERLDEIYELEKAKIALLPAVSGFGHFLYDFPGSGDMESVQDIQPDCEYRLHEETILLRTKWNWDPDQSADQLLRNLELPESEFCLLLAPAFFEVIEKYVPEQLLCFLKGFTCNNTYEGSVKMIQEIAGYSDFDEQEVKKQLKEIILLQLLLKGEQVSEKHFFRTLVS